MYTALFLSLFDRIKQLSGVNPDFSRARAVQEQGISARRRSVLLRGLNNAVPVPLWLAFGEEHQMPFFILH
jgi:hypothetical protein